MLSVVCVPGHRLGRNKWCLFGALNTLRVPLVLSRAGRARRAASRSGPPGTATLAPLSGTAAAAAAAGRRARGRGAGRSARRGAGRRATSRGTDGDGGRATAEVTFGGDDLVVVRAQVQADLRPGVEVRGRVDGTSHTLALANRPILLKGPGAVDGRSVGTSADEDVVGATITDDGALLGCSAGRVVGSEVLDDVVLDQRVSSPAVDSEVAVAVRLVGAGVRDGPCGTRVPAFASHEVTAALPDNTVLTTRTIGVGDWGTSVRPPRVVEPVVRAGRRRSRLTFHQLARGGEGPGEGRKGDEERGERNHGDGVTGNRMNSNEPRSEAQQSNAGPL